MRNSILKCSLFSVFITAGCQSTVIEPINDVSCLWEAQRATSDHVDVYDETALPCRAYDVTGRYSLQDYDDLEDMLADASSREPDAIIYRYKIAEQCAECLPHVIDTIDVLILETIKFK